MDWDIQFFIVFYFALINSPFLENSIEQYFLNFLRKLKLIKLSKKYSSIEFSIAYRFLIELLSELS